MMSDLWYVITQGWVMYDEPPPPLWMRLLAISCGAVFGWLIGRRLSRLSGSVYRRRSDD
jgi:hypothetical protein